MLKLTTRIDSKLILALQIITGVYLALIFLLQGVIYKLVHLRFGILIENDSPFLTFLVFYLLTAPLAIITSNLLNKKRLQYDTALQAGMIANYTFVLMLVSLLLFAPDISIFAIIGAMFFASIFGFAWSALSAVLYEKILLLKIKI
ncbi:hypothetical protein [Pontibacter amylolyticus]|uniref:Polysaccharide biosynthesis protein C-terminal domain-containing protein n=1 Tax=Pontibacter amylolyticus TaxID=1424080 RepID=A0ABQ1W6R2_9BACT|nr:hypothetical protein [Pontibacter amylolyticus]GGG14200.1 hypothetical protein GCM10011323_18310 [Pontibacter amylolyticus]